MNFKSKQKVYLDERAILSYLWIAKVFLGDDDSNQKLRSISTKFCTVNFRCKISVEFVKGQHIISKWWLHI